jgi:CubicO group peptidase (beta-lactamase class C family)
MPFSQNWSKPKPCHAAPADESGETFPEIQSAIYRDNAASELRLIIVWSEVRVRLMATAWWGRYSETEWMSRAWANEPTRAFSLKELVDAAYPSATNHLPVTKGYHYSNTNYILAAMIAEKASEKSFRDLVHELVIEPHGLTSTFYEASTYPESVIKRLAHGYFERCRSCIITLSW